MDFWMRQGRPPTLPSTKVGEWIIALRAAQLREEEDVCPLVFRGLAKSTLQTHRRTLRWLCGLEISQQEEGMSISSLILTKCEKEKVERSWKGSTLATKLATIQGVLANLPVYKDEMPPVLLRLCPEWKLGMKGAGNQARAVLPEQAVVATQKIMQQAILLEPKPEVKATLEIGWLTAARGGDVVKLRNQDIMIMSEGTSVRFVIGKTATSQPYTVCTAPLSQAGKEWVEMRKKEGGEKGWLFPGVTGSQIKDALRRVNPKLEQRSLRRGALQFLASTGMSDHQLLAYSQHRCIDTLRRYLEFGWLSGEGPERAMRASGLGLSEEKWSGTKELRDL